MNKVVQILQRYQTLIVVYPSSCNRMKPVLENLVPHCEKLLRLLRLIEIDQSCVVVVEDVNDMLSGVTFFFSKVIS